jgi:Predicted transcriptional regulators
MQFIKDYTGGRVELGAGTLYGALNSLQEKGWIVSVEGTQSRRKMEYIITALGKSKVEEEKKRLREIMELASKITEKR